MTPGRGTEDRERAFLPLTPALSRKGRGRKRRRGNEVTTHGVSICHSRSPLVIPDVINRESMVFFFLLRGRGFAVAAGFYASLWQAQTFPSGFLHPLTPHPGPLPEGEREEEGEQDDHPQ